jgi:aryl-alcohol dehydrogenase-like predicted oxidoreductase
LAHRRADQPADLGCRARRGDQLLRHRRRLRRGRLGGNPRSLARRRCLPARQGGPGHQAVPPVDRGPNTGGLSALHIRRAVEDSLRRLQTDHIDLYQFHHIDRNTPWEEIWEATERLVRDGKVVYVGSSNFAGWHLAAAQEAAKARHFLGLVSEQSIYNLMERTIELEVLPAARQYGIGLLPWSPLAGGLLAGALAEATGGRRGDDSALLGHSAREQRIAEHRDSLGQYEALAAHLGVTPTALALAWLLSRPGVTAPVLGPRTLDQLTGSLPALDITIDGPTSSTLDKLFPGPGGEAPDAYTWS